MTATDPAPTTAQLQQLYRQARLQDADVPAIVVLHLGAQHSAIAIGTGTQAQSVQEFALGYERAGAASFQTTPPTPLALEHAIQWVEDGVMPLHAVLPLQAQLYSGDACVRAIASFCGLGSGAALAQSEPLVLTLEAVEHGFNRLVAVVQGRPGASEGLPAANGFAMALLVLREFMHHLQFAQITLLDAGAGA